MPKARTSPGDVTGRKRDQLQKEHAEELAKRGDEISLAQAEEAERNQNGVFDPATGEEIPTQQARTDLTPEEAAEAFRTTASVGLAPGTRQVGDPGTEVDDDGILYVDGMEDGVQTNETPIIGVGQESPFPVVGGAPNDEIVRQIVDDDSYAARRGGISNTPDVIDSGVQLADEGTKVIRVNTTLEQVTIGVGTEYNFEEGKQYRVPAHVAAHLEEKGYVWH